MRRRKLWTSSRRNSRDKSLKNILQQKEIILVEAKATEWERTIEN